MSKDHPVQKELEELAKQISQDQDKTAAAEKRVKVDATFKKAVKKMGQTPLPKKKERIVFFLLIVTSGI